MDASDEENREENVGINIQENLGEAPFSEIPQNPIPQDIVSSNQLKENEDSAIPRLLKAPDSGQPETVKQKKTVNEWFSSKKWKTNPFTFSISPALFVGYRAEASRLLMSLEERHKFTLLLGPTGSGKTTLLKWLSQRLPKKYDMLYVSKPPESPYQFITMFNDKFKPPLLLRPFSPRINNIYQIPDFLNKKLKNKHLVVLMDEAHEARLEVLEWLRVLGDQIENISFVFSALPIFEQHLTDKLETFRKRVAAKVELLSLTKEETYEMIRKRMRNVGGSGNELTDEMLNAIYNRTGGFPREVLRFCDELVNDAILSGEDELKLSAKSPKISTEKVTFDALEKMTPMQKEILELLSRSPLSPGQIADKLNLEKYKSRQHAVRSVNNVVKRLLEDGYLERHPQEKTFTYSLVPKIRTLFVKA